MLSKNWFSFTLLFLFTILLSYISSEFLNVYDLTLNSLAEQITRKELENLIDARQKWQWIGYLLIPLLLLIKITLISGVLDIGCFFFDTCKIGELVARLNDTQRVQRVISQIVGNVVINALVTIVSLGFLFYYSWQTGLIASISLPFYFILIYSFNKRIISAQKEVMQGYAFSESNYITSMQGIATIKNNNRQIIFQKINQLIYGSFQEKSFNLGKINVRLSVFSGVFSVLFLMSILGYNSIQVYNEVMQLGELMAVLGVAGSLLPSVASLALITIPINEAKVAFNRMYEFASMEKEQKGNIEISNFNSLEIKNVSFRFAGRSQLLKNINIRVNKNECIAIVGESGSGKSTLGQVLQKFYAFENGAIIINNKINFFDIDTKNWRTILGVVPQDVTIFGGNIITNILLGQEDTPENIVKFCQDYGFETFINTLPQSYATILGEEGINLSGGQKQLIALMRALYKKPKVLLLDEFTSAMDRKTEKFVLNLLNKLKPELSIIFISHRLHSLPKIADRIYVLENGIISNFGTHDELMKTTNFYSQFWKEILV
jgi:ABC-type bacteriocin/lantibiotic exporter with double-glycine peptidase domain